MIKEELEKQENLTREEYLFLFPDENIKKKLGHIAVESGSLFLSDFQNLAGMQIIQDRKRLSEFANCVYYTGPKEIGGGIGFHVPKKGVYSVNGLYKDETLLKIEIDFVEPFWSDNAKDKDL